MQILKKSKRFSMCSLGFHETKSSFSFWKHLQCLVLLVSGELLARGLEGCVAVDAYSINSNYLVFTLCNENVLSFV